MDRHKQDDKTPISGKNAETYKSDKLAKNLTAEYTTLGERIAAAYQAWEWTMAEMEKMGGE